MLQNVNMDYTTNCSAFAADSLACSVLDSRPSRRRSSAIESVNDASIAMTNFSRNMSQNSALEAIVTALQRTHLPGPVLTTNSTFLGQGSQFVVYRSLMTRNTYSGRTGTSVAVKQPKFRLDPDLELNMSDVEAHKPLHSLYLEIISLTTPILQRHPCIARLLGWTYDIEDFRFLPRLVMELAVTNLANLLKDVSEKVDLSTSTVCSLCVNVGAGLDAVHECGIIHGDLKPENILVFNEENRYIAKLADFGLSVAEVEASGSVRLGGTVGWMAPEVEACELLRPTALVKTDNYSFGLLMWRVIFHSGKPFQTLTTETPSFLAEQDFQGLTDEVREELLSCIRSPIGAFLENDPEKRPVFITEEVEPHSNDLASSNEEYEEVEDDVSPFSTYPYFTWEVLPVPHMFLRGMLERCQKSPDTVPVSTVLAISLALTLPSAHTVIGMAESSGNFLEEVVDLLYVAAIRGCYAAQGIFSSILRCFEYTIDAKYHKLVEPWTQSALLAGSVLVRDDMRKAGNFRIILDVLNDFRDHGGYNVYYDSTVDKELVRDYKSPNPHHDQETLIHPLAKYGTPDELFRYLQSGTSMNPEWFETIEHNMGSVLYDACIRGSWRIIEMVLGHKPDASQRHTMFGVTCLHWVFNIDERYQAAALASLIRCGGAVNALASMAVPFPCYPFLLPPGSPLHWAVVLRCNDTIRHLIENGADASVRDGTDPYQWDDTVRILDVVGGSDFDAFSMPRPDTDGLSALDYAAMQYDPFIFQLFSRYGREIDLNATDEEGFSVLYRLSANPIRRTMLGVTYSIRAFQGSHAERYQSLRETINAIRNLGGNLEQLSKGEAVSGKAYWRYWQYTPLMLAVRMGEPEVVMALLEAGANVDMRNDAGRTALHFCPPNAKAYFDCVNLLFTYNPNINAVDNVGESPVAIAATSKALDVVDKLLVLGADVGAKVYTTESYSSQGDIVMVTESIFAAMAHHERIGRADPDPIVAGLMEKHLFGCPDKAKRERIMNIGRERRSDDYDTLLYHYTFSCMPRCIEALLRHGVDANSLTKCSQWRVKEGTNQLYMATWDETPLDMILQIKKERAKKMLEDRHWSAQEYERLCQRDNEIESLLRNAGGLTHAPTTHSPHMVFS